MGRGVTHVDLFSGIGGFALAASWFGFRTVAFVECDEFCQGKLSKNFPGVPIYDDVRTFDALPYYGCDVVTGGFPCQDISVANRNRKGLGGERSSLWFPMLGVVGRARPAYVLVENSPNLVNLGLEVCLAGLESHGYAARPFVVPASGVGAWHKRERCIILAKRIGAHDNGLGSEPGRRKAVPPQSLFDDEERDGQVEEQEGIDLVRRVGPDLAGDDRKARVQVQGEARRTPFQHRRMDSGFGERSRLFEPKLCGDIHGIPQGLDRLKSLGNAVVPLHVAPFLEAIAKELKYGTV